MKKDQASIDGFVPRNRASASAKKVDSIEVNKAKTTKRRAAPAKKIATPANEDENLEKMLENLEVDDLQNNDQNTPRRTPKEQSKKEKKLTKKLQKRNQKRAQKGKKPLSVQQFKRRRNIKRFFLIILMALLIALGYYGYKTWNNFDKVFSGNILDVLKKDKLKEDSLGRTNILVFGTSPAGWDGEDLADSIMVISLNQETGEAYTMSLPRDLWVAHTCTNWLGTTAGKLNESYGCGKMEALAISDDAAAAETAGQQEIAKAAETVLGLEIHYNVHVNWQVLTQIVDSIGGIDLTIEVYDGSDEMYDVATNVRYKNGEQVHLNGEQALALSRARGSHGGYGLSGGNFDREKNQQKILKATADKIKSSGLTSFTSIMGMMEALGDNVQTNIQSSELQTIADLAQEFDASKIKSLPFTDSENSINLMTTGNVGGASVVVPTAGTFSYSDIQAYVAKNTNSSDVAKEEAKIVILNGTQISGLAAEQEIKLASEGYTITATDTAPTQDYTKTKIYIINTEKPKTAKKLSEKFGVETTENLPSWSSNYDADIIIVLGED